MSGTAIIMFFIMGGLLAAVIGSPFWASRNQRGASAFKDQVTLSGLEDHLLRLARAVRDLDFDYDTGKMPEQDYIEQRKQIIGQGVSVLIRLDEARKDQDVLDDEIENLIEAYKQSS